MAIVAFHSWFNFSRAAIDEIHRAERSERLPVAKSLVFRRVVSVVGQTVFARFLRWAADIVIDYVDRKANRLTASAIWFEGAKDDFLAQIVERADPPDSALLKHIEDFEAANAELLVQCRLNLEQLRSQNPNSRIAASFDRLIQAATRLHAAMDEIKMITQSAIASSSELNEIKVINNSIDLKIANFLDEDEPVDPELVKLADMAIQRIRSTSPTH